MAEGSKQLLVDLCNIKADTQADISHKHQTRDLQPFDFMLRVKLSSPIRRVSTSNCNASHALSC